MSKRTEKNSGLVRTEDRGCAPDASRGGSDHGLINGETSPEAGIVVNASSLPNPARDAGRRYTSFDRLQES
jgi:hypothetical protein